jgi:hypothetical protein
MPGLPTLSPSTRNRPPANANAPLPSYGKLPPFPRLGTRPSHAQHAATRNAGRAARYAAHANRASAPPQQHSLAHVIALDN